MSDCLCCHKPNAYDAQRGWAVLKPFPEAEGGCCADCTGKLVAAYARQFRCMAPAEPPSPKHEPA